MTYARHHAKCAKEGCNTLIKKGWFCPSHWFALTLELRQAVLAAFRAATDAHAKSPREEQDRLNRAYGVAFRDCQDHLRRVPANDAAVRSTVAHVDGKPVHYTEGRRL